jgi:hypothetical protein
VIKFTVLLAQEEQITMQAHENSIKVNIILQQREDGKTIASVLEAPDCNVAENSREKAISSIRESLMKKLNKAEVLCLG